MTVILMSTKLLVRAKLQETGFCVKNPENYYLNRSILKSIAVGNNLLHFLLKIMGVLLFILKKIGNLQGTSKFIVALIVFRKQKLLVL